MKECEKANVDSDYGTEDMTESANSYFKSSFARSMAFQNTGICKFVDRDYTRTEMQDEYYADYMPGYPPVFANISKSANVSPVKSFTKSNKSSVHARRNSVQVMDDKYDNDKCSVYNSENKESSMEEEIMRLKAECQNLAEENRRLQRLSLQSSNASLLQSQVDSLQWQLRQTESSRQMYRAVMEQVSKFLERVHKNLDIISSKMSTSPKTKTSRFPRSRSAHTMAGTCTSNNNISSSRCSSPSPTHYSTISNSTQITNSSRIDQFHELDSPQHSFAEYTWKPSRPPSEHVTLEKLSQESFRFYRTVQSLLNTRGPDLIYRLTPSTSEVTLPDEKMDNTSVGSCASLYQSGCVGNRKSFDTSSSGSTQFPLVDDLETAVPLKISETLNSKPGIVEDESGFSSMSSFHDVNVMYPKLGLPIVDCDESKHRRWNSTPVDKMYESNNISLNFCNNEMLQVLWV